MTRVSWIVVETTAATCLSTMAPVVGLTVGACAIVAGGSSGIVGRGVHSIKVVFVVVLGQIFLEMVEVTVLISMVYATSCVAEHSEIVLT